MRAYMYMQSVCVGVCACQRWEYKICCFFLFLLVMGTRDGFQHEGKMSRFKFLLFTPEEVSLDGDKV